MVSIANITEVVGAVGKIPGVSGLINIGKALGIAVIVYLIFLIIRSIVSINYSLRFKRLTQNVEEINQKMDTLIGKEKGEKGKSRKDRKK